MLKVFITLFFFERKDSEADGKIMEEAYVERRARLKLDDYPIINALRKNSRTSLKKMATKLGLPVSTVCDRVSKYQKNGVLRHTSLLDFRKASYHIRHIVAIAVPNDKKKVMEYLEKHPSINNLYSINSGFDFLIETIFRDDREFAEFMRILRTQYDTGITATYSVIDDVKREGVELQPDVEHGRN